MLQENIKVATIENRINWIDQVKGFTIFLVVYGHNFPFLEKYLYSFHMPLFFMIAGFFHPKESNIGNLKKRIKAILIPYFIWSFFLYLFWFFISSKFGESVEFNLSPIKNLTGIIYAQGDRAYMDWGIPMWFLPGLFMTFLTFFLLKKIKNNYLLFTTLIILPVIGFLYSRNISTNLPWSINIALVALVFYSFGYYGFQMINITPRNTSLFLAILLGLLNLCFYNNNIKIDMYRAHYGNEFLFLLNGISGSLFVLFFFKAFPYFLFFKFIGQFSMIILALQLITMSFIKFILLYGFHQSDFNFSECERFFYSIIQIALLIPVFYFINKYIPILNGGYKKI